MKRKENESYQEYKERRKLANQEAKKRSKGYLYWNSSQRGTFTKELKEQLDKEVAKKIEEFNRGEK